MIDVGRVPDAIQWHEGMLLGPQHFQQWNLRQDALLAYHLQLAAPFHWGVKRLRFDPVALGRGVLRILELEAVLPDGLLVHHAEGGEQDLDVDLTPLQAQLRRDDLMVHLAVPALRSSGTPVKGTLARYLSVEGEPVADENTGEQEIGIPRLRPRLSLLVTERLEQKYVGLPLAKVAYRGEGFVVTDYVPPLLVAPPQSPIGELCASVASRLREKAMLLAERKTDGGGRADGGFVRETREIIRALVSALPPLEAQLAMGRSHPYPLYLSLCAIAGEVAAISPRMIPPVFAPYRHDDPHASFTLVADYLWETLGLLHERYNAQTFQLEEGVFRLQLRDGWMGEDLLIGVKVGEMGEREAAEWFEHALIGTSESVASIRLKRVRGAERRALEDGEVPDLGLVQGMLLFRVKADPQFIYPRGVLEIFGMLEAASRGDLPDALVLYVQNVA